MRHELIGTLLLLIVLVAECYTFWGIRREYKKLSQMEEQPNVRKQWKS